MATASDIIAVRVSPQLKEDANDLFKRLGLDVSTAVKMFLTQSVTEQRIPFESRLDGAMKPSRKLKKAMKETEAILSGKKKTKFYTDVDQMFEDILNGKKS